MEFAINRDQILKPLSHACGIIEKKTTLKPDFKELVDQEAYVCIDFANLLAKLSKNLIENHFSSFSFELLSILEATDGINVIEIITEIKTDTEIAMPISLNNCPTGKSSNKIGMNTTTVVSAEPSIGAQTCFEPLYEAIGADMPDCFNL